MQINAANCPMLICLGTALQGQCVGEGPSIIWVNPHYYEPPTKTFSLQLHEKTHIPLPASYCASSFPNMKNKKDIFQNSTYRVKPRVRKRPYQ